MELALARSTHGLPVPSQLGDDALHVAHRFARRAIERDPVSFERLESMVRGWILLNALYLPSVELLQAPIGGLRIFLDTPLVLSAIGLANDAARDATAELLELPERLHAVAVVHHHMRKRP